MKLGNPTVLRTKNIGTPPLIRLKPFLLAKNPMVNLCMLCMALFELCGFRIAEKCMNIGARPFGLRRKLVPASVVRPLQARKKLRVLALCVRMTCLGTCLRLKRATPLCTTKLLSSDGLWVLIPRAPRPLDIPMFRPACRVRLAVLEWNPLRSLSPAPAPLWLRALALVSVSPGVIGPPASTSCKSSAVTLLQLDPRVTP